MSRQRAGLVKKLRYRAWSLPRPREANAALLLLGSLRRLGWFESAREKRPIDAAGLPLPWYAYPAIFWLESIVGGTETVFEYGIGNSTLWWAARVARVHGVDHDEEWIARVRSTAPSNARISYQACAGTEVSAPEGDPYVGAAAATGLKFDVIVIDGRARVSCAAEVSKSLAPDGLVLLDNSDRPKLAPAHDTLASQGFGRIDFVGLAPGGTNVVATSAFCRSWTRWLQKPRPPKYWGTNLEEFVLPPGPFVR